MKDVKDIVQLIDIYNIVVVFQDIKNSTQSYGYISFVKNRIKEALAEDFFLICKKHTSETFFREMLKELFNNCDFVSFNMLNFPDNLMDIISEIIENRDFGYSVVIAPSVKNHFQRFFQAFQTIIVKHLLILGNDFSYYVTIGEDFWGKSIVVTQPYQTTNSEFQILKEFCGYCASNQNIKQVRLDLINLEQFKTLRRLYSNLKRPLYEKKEPKYDEIIEQKIKDDKKFNALSQHSEQTYTLPQVLLPLQSIIRAQHFDYASLDEIRASCSYWDNLLKGKQKDIMK